MKKVVIIGGGIVGLSTAYYLQKEGCEVIVIDKSDIKSSASFVNAGIICPSHLIPLSSPGMVASGLKMMFNQASSFYLKPRFDVDLWQWAWAFNKSATAKHVTYAAPLIKDLTVLSRDLFQDMKDEKIFNFQFERKGLLMCYQTAKLEDKEAHLAKVARTQGLDVKHLNKVELSKMEPELNAEGAFHYLCDAHSTPDEFMNHMKAYLKTRGVSIYNNEVVSDFSFNHNSINSLTATNQSFEFDELVIANGSWSPILAKKLGLKLLVQAGRGYCLNFLRPTNIKYPAILAEPNTAVTPMNGFTRFGGTMEIAGLNHNINPVCVQTIIDAAKAFYPNLTFTNAEMDNATCGLRPLSPDGLPFIGRTKKYKNVCFATGHAMLGWSQGPGTGKLISEIITDKQPSIAAEGFSPDRKF